MTISIPTISRQGTLRQRVLGPLRQYLGGRRGLLVLGGGALALGIALSWSWLAAAGLLPLLSVLPCLGMCVFAHCTSKTTADPANLQTLPDQTPPDLLSGSKDALQLVRTSDGSWDMPANTNH
ncbi:hypothetical protein LJR231_004191 [Phyllobacterium sp. LjRoot231]|uniref:hypothetical protein n=1 Tax=Phyllobacterium sp. LjRoot231 TaxID=3342289 RepID=UPI003ED0A480